MADSKKTVRTAKFEVKTVGGDWAETTMRWHALAKTLQDAGNFIWQEWLVWHHAGNSRSRYKEWLEKRETRGKKEAGKCPVDMFPPELRKEIDRKLSQEYPHLHSRVKTLFVKRLVDTAKKRKATKGSLPWLAAILLCQEGVPSYTRPHPIPFDNNNAEWHVPETRNGDYWLKLRVHRIENSTGRATSIEDWVELRSRNKQRDVLDRIVSGEYKFCGSRLRWDRGKRKWFVDLCYQMPRQVVAELDSSRQAMLVAYRSQPWKLIFRTPEGRARFVQIGGRGNPIAAMRKKLLSTRWDRQQCYHWGSRARKGHGLGRARRDMVRGEQTWRRFTVQYNKDCVSKVADICVEHRIGRLTYAMPEGNYANSRFLVTAGKIEGRQDSTGWTWFDVKTRLEQKCQHLGIDLDTKKVGGLRAPEDKGKSESRTKVCNKGRAKVGSGGKNGRKKKGKLKRGRELGAGQVEEVSK